MQRLLQLSPPLPLETLKGPGIAHLLCDEGPEWNTMWGVALDASGEFWWFDNAEIRFTVNHTLGRRVPAQP